MQASRARDVGEYGDGARGESQAVSAYGGASTTRRLPQHVGKVVMPIDPETQRRVGSRGVLRVLIWDGSKRSVALPRL